MPDDDPLAEARELLERLKRAREEGEEPEDPEEDPIFDPTVKGVKDEQFDEEAGFRKGPPRIWED